MKQKVDKSWKVISTPNKKFKALIKVDGEEISDCIHATDTETATHYLTADWTPPLYRSKSFKIISIVEETTIT